MSETMSDSSRSYKFRPTPEQLVGYYLPNLRDGKSFKEILYRPVYGSELPWEVFTDHDPIWEFNKKGNKKFVYTFTKLTRVGSRNYVRTAGGGTWEGATIQPIQNFRGDVIGHKRQFKFNAKNTGKLGRWIMHEYTSTLVKNDTALCKITVDGFQLPKPSSGSDSDVGSRKRKTLDSEVEDCIEKRPRTTTEKEEECDVNVQQQISEAVDYLLSDDNNLKEYDVNIQQQIISELADRILNDDAVSSPGGELEDIIATYGELL